jgi:alpha-L-rhamnosidase
MLSLYDLTVEQRTEPFGLDERHPAFSWKLRSEKKNVIQASYRVLVMNHAETVWDSGLSKAPRASL